MTSSGGTGQVTALLLTAADLVSSGADGEQYRGRFADLLRAVRGVRSVRAVPRPESQARQGFFLLPLPPVRGRAGAREALLVELARMGDRRWSGRAQRDRLESVLVFLSHALAMPALRDSVSAAPLLLLGLTRDSWFPCTGRTARELGTPQDPDRAAGPLTMVDPRDRITALRAFAKVHSGLKTSARAHLRLSRRAGDELTVNAFFIDLTGVPGIDGIIVAGHDVTQAGADRAAVRELLPRLPHAAFLIGHDGAVVLANRRFAQLTGTPGWPGTGEDRALWTVAAGCQDQQDAFRRFQSVLTARRGTADVTLGAGRTLVAERRPLVESGTETGALWTFEVRDDRPAAEEPDARHGKALAAVAQEVSAPVTALLSLGGLLGDTRLGAGAMEQRSTAEVINRNAGRLRRLADHLLLLNRLDRGELRVRRTEVDVPSLVAEVVAATASGAIRQVATPGPTAHVDSALLRQILGEVLENAVRYGESRSIRVTTGFAAGWWTVEIADSGIGIPPGELDRVARPFERGTNVVNGGYPGAGLGLAIAEELVKAHGGTLRLSSVFGVGTTVAIGLKA
ncbi:HAMP domain-containing sensor histidine kinase [Amycolatopsis sp. GM8]|uniref:sensor histidine kinase n=1 Tax=Amycolatopsis sp. GM8 TaxID=2896530 RepID=UPI001F1E1BF2|nr:HAMP domain-containing sensor histidine kinase [Amycolatopsis sp. GM8]